MSVSLTPCSVPGQTANFTLGEEEMELGTGKLECGICECSLGQSLITGVHGEAGAERMKVTQHFLLKYEYLYFHRLYLQILLWRK